MKAIRYTGLVLFLFSFFLFLGIFFMSSYELSREDYQSIVKPEHQELLDPYFDDIIDESYSLSISFVNVVNGAINTNNQKMRAEQQWDKVIYDQYASNLTRVATHGIIKEHTSLLFILVFVIGTIGSLMFILPQVQLGGPSGIKNNGIFHHALNNRGWLGISIGVLLVAFYVLLYFYDAYIMNWIILVDPVQKLINPSAQASQWFLYGFLYTFAVLVMGIRMIIKYRHSKYQIVRTLSVMFFQTAFAFILPEILVRLNQPYFDFKNMWPLDYDFFDAWHIQSLTTAGGLGIFMFAWGITIFVVGVPVFVFFFGKRWYCSWVCGCGGLAETAGDSFRQLSDKSVKAWKIERYLIHGVLVFSIIMTIGVLYTFITGSNTLLGLNTYTWLRQPYGFLIGSIFSGVIGTGFYPIMGNRVWCRFGCPLAAYLGIVQRFKSRFRITTNGGQCISCGNCSTYCEMGIDVRWYAQRGQNIVRSSCVGCGVCSAVCPRGVLNLENRDEEGRFGEPILIGNDGIQLEK
ncbi:MAG: FeS-binding protein [Flammeovirgaceae bacterium]|nr:FeS-binding protein [Flammeovirgaceae bacterium]HCX24373.1 FeS-binding protein [Cytophagales bacterium]|tara:strand:- start:3867 stop:5420 length:1554 start_codon:yes stop_codon:yes gene_type:complete